MGTEMRRVNPTGSTGVLGVFPPPARDPVLVVVHGVRGNHLPFFLCVRMFPLSTSFRGMHPTGAGQFEFVVGTIELCLLCTQTACPAVHFILHSA